jgi:dTDP-4-amino-4,6-dideoxygalactose transaminase
MPTQCTGFEFLGYHIGEFPEAEYLGENGIHIGVHQDLRRKECDYVLDIMDKFISENG